MNEGDFLDLLSRFVQRPVLAVVPERHVYLWHGAAERLNRHLPGDVGRGADLHALAAGLPRAPRATDEARRLLLDAIRSHLGSFVTEGRQQVVVATGCDLLSRYRVPLAPFFELASDSTAVVLTVEPEETRFLPLEPLPEYVALNARATYDYLRAALGEEAVIDTAEELP